MVLTGLGLPKLYHLIYPKVLTGLGMLVFFTDLSVMKFQVRYLALFLLFSVIDGFEWFWMGSLPTLFLIYINDLPDDVIYDIAIFADDNDTTVYSKCDQASDLWQQLELTSEIESDLPDTVDRDKK